MLEFLVIIIPLFIALNYSAIHCAGNACVYIIALLYRSRNYLLLKSKKINDINILK